MRPRSLATGLAAVALVLSACGTPDAADATTTSPTTDAAERVDNGADHNSTQTRRERRSDRRVTDDVLLDHLRTLPEMPRDVEDILASGAVTPETVTFGSGTPFNDLEYTVFDTDYIEGETSGFDTYIPVDPGDPYPGANEVRSLHAVSNAIVNSIYQGAQGDRIVLGLPGNDGPFFRSPGDGTDDDYVSIVNFDFVSGFIQLNGNARDYRVIEAGPDDGVASDGHYLVYTGDYRRLGEVDLVAFIHRCDDTSNGQADRGGADPAPGQARPGNADRGQGVDRGQGADRAGRRAARGASGADGGQTAGRGRALDQNGDPAGTPGSPFDDLPEDPLCNDSQALSLDDPNQFRFVDVEPQRTPVRGLLVQDGTPDTEIVGGTAVDAHSNTYLVGAGGGSLAGDDQHDHALFVAKYGPDGDRAWVTDIPVPDGGLLFDVVADDQYLYAVGRMFGALDGFESGGTWDGIIVKVDQTTGDVVDTDQWGNVGIDGYGSVTLDDAGSLYVTGAGSPEGAELDPEGTGAGDAAFLVAKHSTDTLDNVWRRLDPVLPESTNVAEAWSGMTYIPADEPGAGQLVTGGWFRNNPTAADGFLIAYDQLNTEDPQRVTTAVVASEGFRADWIYDHDAGPDGSLYAVGATTGDLAGPARGDGDAFIAKYQPGLTDPRFVSIATDAADRLEEVVVGDDGAVFAVGYTYGDLAESNSDSSGSSADIIVIEFDADLNEVAHYQFGTPYEERATMAIDHESGRIVLGGMTEGSMGRANAGSYDSFVIELERRRNQN